MGAPATDRRPPRRPPTWQLLLAGGAAVVIVVGAVVLALAERGADEPVATGGPTTSTSPSVVAPTSTVVFQAPPPRPRVTTTTIAPVTTTTVAPTSTSTPTSSTTPAPRPVAAQPGPTVETTAGDHSAMRGALVGARGRWRSDAPADGYTYRTRPVCFCPAADNEITVSHDGRVTAQRTIAGGPETDPPTIEDLFDLLEEAIADDAARIRASFDVRYGYPVTFFVDLDERMADEEQGRETDWLSPR